MIISWLFILLGFFFVIISTVGILRFSEFYNKFHPASVTEALGIPLIIIGLIIKSGISLIMFKMLFIMVIIWITSSISSHAIAAAAYKK